MFRRSLQADDRTVLSSIARAVVVVAGVGIFLVAGVCGVGSFSVGLFQNLWLAIRLDKPTGRYRLFVDNATAEVFVSDCQY